MAAGRPAPDEEIHDGEVVVRRTSHARFLAGAWVFPGGAVDPGDGAGQAGLRAAAIREVQEEAGVTLDPGSELVAFSNWITPERVQIRFDTWFYLAAMPAAQEPRVDGREIVEARWLTPSDAVAAAESGEMAIVFPTVKHLERIAGYDSAEQLLTDARGLTVTPVEPRVIGSGEQARIVLPGEPGYED
jgi:8-oxo-dGTP pyrophosphatase MutT (NUDIX family)